MSRVASDWAWSLSIKPASLKLLLLSLADRADEYHCCYPSVERLVKDTGLDRKTIISNIGKLVNAGVLTDTGKRAGRTGQVKVYRLSMVKTDEQICLSSTATKSAGNGTVPKPEQSQKRTLNSPKNGTCNSPKNGTQNQSIEPPIEPLKDLSQKTRKKSQQKKSEFDFSSWPEKPSEQVLADWMKVRKEQRAPLTQTAITRMAGELHQAHAGGMSVDDCIGLAAEKGWRGFKYQWALNALGDNRNFGNGSRGQGSDGIDWDDNSWADGLVIQFPASGGKP